MAEGKSDKTVTIVTTQVICQLLVMSRQRLEQLVNDGVIKRHSKGHFVLVDTIQAYVKWMRDDARRSSKSAADSRVRDARAHEIEIRTAERMGRLVAIEDFFAMIEGLVGIFRSEVGGLPARVTRDLTLRKKLEQETNELIRRINQHAIETVERLEAGRQADDAVTVDDTGRMGGEQSDLRKIGGYTGTA